MEKIYAEKERALADWDNQHKETLVEESNFDKTQMRLKDEELRAFIQETDGDMIRIAVNMPSTKPLAYGMLLTIIKAIAINNDESFESVLNELTAMHSADIVGKVS